MRVIEVVERRRHGEGVPDEKGHLERLGDLFERLERPPAGPDDVPEAVVEVLGCEGRDRRDLVFLEPSREPLLLQLTKDVRGADGGVLEVRAGVSLERQRLVEVERDDLVPGETGHIDPEGSDADRFDPAEVRGLPRCPGEDLVARLLGEAVEEVVRLHAEPLPARHLDEGAGAVLVRKVDPHRLGGGGGQGDHLVREVDRAVGRLGKAGAPDGLLYHLLEVRLPHVDDVDDALAVAVPPARRRVRPFRVVTGPVERGGAVGGVELGLAERIAVGRRLILEVGRKEAQLPELVGDVLPGIRHGAVRADEDLVGVLHPLEIGRAFEAHHPAARVLPFGLHLGRVHLLQKLERGRPEPAAEDVALAREEVVGDADPPHRQR